MTAYWKNHPPIHVMIASYFGIGDDAKKADNENADFAELLSQIPQV